MPWVVVISVSVASARQDEIGTLARSFSDMVINLDRHQQQLKAVNEIAAGILGARPCEDALNDVVQAACRLTGAGSAAIILDYDFYDGIELLKLSVTARERFTEVELQQRSNRTLRVT
ncbi:MAG: hypothetical protein R2932_50680 [Caldilineaceae bacterium]